MGRFFLTRLAMAVPTTLIVAITVFLLIRLIPGDPVTVLLGDMPNPKAVAALQAKLGLDQRLPVQFLYWAKHALLGDFGKSISQGEDVLPLVLQRFTVSACIVVAAVFFASLIAVPAGMIAAWNQNKSIDFILIGTATLLLSIPAFWLGLLLLVLFGLKLHWLPVLGYVSLSEDWRRGVIYMVMPVLTLLLTEAGILIRMARASTLEVLRLDYITHARAKGLSEFAILSRHAFRNAFAPTWTLIGLILGNLLGSIAVVETVFNIPGLGRLLIDSIFARDYPVVQGCLIFVALVYVVVNLVVDLMYPFFDPRIAAE